MTLKLMTQILTPLLLIASLFACSGPMLHDQKTHPLLETYSFELGDTRPKSNRQARLDDDDAIYYYGDNDTSPGKIELLKHALEFQLGERLSESELSISMFEISNYHGAIRNLQYGYRHYKTNANWIHGEIHGTINGTRFKVIHESEYEYTSLSRVPSHTTAFRSEEAMMTVDEIANQIIKDAVDKIESHCDC